MFTFLPTVSDAEVQVPSSGMCRVKTSQARIPKKASSPIGSQSLLMARAVATTIGSSAKAIAPRNQPVSLREP